MAHDLCIVQLECVGLRKTTPRKLVQKLTCVTFKRDKIVDLAAERRFDRHIHDVETCVHGAWCVEGDTHVSANFTKDPR